MYIKCTFHIVCIVCTIHTCVPYVYGYFYCIYIATYYGNIIHQRCRLMHFYTYTPAYMFMWMHMHHIHLTAGLNVYTHAQYVLLQLSTNPSDCIVIEDCNFLLVQLWVQYQLAFWRLKFKFIDHVQKYSSIIWPLQQVHLVVLI